jgi:hypothetical protein
VTATRPGAPFPMKMKLGRNVVLIS